jgi:hypothetical protein
LLRIWYSAACIDGSSLCDSFVLVNRKGDRGDFGDLRLRGDRGESMKSCSYCCSSTAVEPASVSGCGTVFRVIVPLLFAGWGGFRLAVPQIAKCLVCTAFRYRDCVTISEERSACARCCGACEGFLGVEVRCKAMPRGPGRTRRQGEVSR